MELCVSTTLGRVARQDSELSSLELKGPPGQLNSGFLDPVCALDSPLGN